MTTMNDHSPDKVNHLTASDHDLLMILHTKMDRALSDIKELSENFAGRLAVVEQNKLERSEAERMVAAAKAEAEKEHATIKEKQEDHEKRVRRLERYVWLAIGALAILEVLLGFAKA